jgi:hypothetical protein
LGIAGGFAVLVLVGFGFVVHLLRKRDATLAKYAQMFEGRGGGELGQAPANQNQGISAMGNGAMAGMGQPPHNITAARNNWSALPNTQMQQQSAASFGGTSYGGPSSAIGGAATTQAGQAWGNRPTSMVNTAGAAGNGQTRTWVQPTGQVYSQ